MVFALVHAASGLPVCGMLQEFAGNHLNHELAKQEYATQRMGLAMMHKAVDVCPEESPHKLGICIYAIGCSDHSSNLAVQIDLGPEEVMWARRHQTHKRLQWMLDAFEPKIHDTLFAAAGYQIHAWTAIQIGYRALALFGDIELAKRYMQKHVAYMVSDDKPDLDKHGPGMVLWTW